MRNIGIGNIVSLVLAVILIGGILLGYYGIYMYIILGLLMIIFIIQEETS